MHLLLGRRRGIGILFYLVFRGFRNGDPVVISITVLVLALIIGVACFKKFAAQ